MRALLPRIRRAERWLYDHRVKLIGACWMALVAYLVCTGHEKAGESTGIVSLLFHVLAARQGGGDTNDAELTI